VTQEWKGRLDPRIAIQMRVDIEYPRGGAWNRAQTLDLSASGSYLAFGENLPLKAQVGCRIYLPPAAGQEDRVIDCEAVVVRVDTPGQGVRDWRYGLYFLGLADGDLQAIRRFVFSKM
jgi:c-di-GMP-binding flagellar brake protein YcgR